MTLQEKLTRVLASATSLFIVPGFANTKMVDIAKSAHLAVGTLYSLFKSKDDLLTFVFEATLDPTIIEHNYSLPIHTNSKASLISKTAAVYQLEGNNMATIFENSLDDQSFKMLLQYIFKTFDRFGAYFLILERNPQTNSELVTMYKQYRKAFYQNVAQFLTTLMKIHVIRQLNHPEDDAMMIIDELFWWSAHKKYDSFEFYNNDLAYATVKESVTDQLLASYTNSLH